MLVFGPQPCGVENRELGGVLPVLLFSSSEPAGNEPSGVAASPNGSDPVGNSTPLASTVMPAPSSAPISEGSCSSSAMLPFCPASQPTTASSGSRSICGLSGRPEKYRSVVLVPLKFAVAVVNGVVVVSLGQL